MKRNVEIFMIKYLTVLDYNECYHSLLTNTVTPWNAEAVIGDMCQFWSGMKLEEIMPQEMHWLSLVGKAGDLDQSCM